MEEKTFSIPALRSSVEEILNDHDLIASQKLFTEIFGSIAGISAVINSSRQIVYANETFLEFLGIKSLEPVLGKRTGEVISCINSEVGSLGCGTSAACNYCGAVNAIFQSQETNSKTVRETSISSVIDGEMKSWDLKITSTPIMLAGQEFYILSLQDISFQNRLAALEKIFFHDLLNIASGLNGLLTIMKEGIDPEETYDLIIKSEEVSRDIIEEIMMYKQLRAAEEGDIQIKPEKVNSVESIGSVIGIISSHEAGHKKVVLIAEDSYDTEFITDRILLQRIIINMLKNALEATTCEGIVLAGAENRGENIRFWVRNEGIMPHHIQMQIFKRSFSTKGKGRGLGTYSVRLLAENYLKGKAGFISNEEEGTIFFVDLPV
jgi:nitrogen-specific signal transduction histidine kinase